MEELYGDDWGRKGATLSDKTAREEFGLTQDEIIAAIRAGKLRQLRAQLKALEERRVALLSELAEQATGS